MESGLISVRTRTAFFTRKCCLRCSFTPLFSGLYVQSSSLNWAPRTGSPEHLRQGCASERGRGASGTTAKTGWVAVSNPRLASVWGKRAHRERSQVCDALPLPPARPSRGVRLLARRARRHLQR